MLVLTRKEGESIVIGEGIEITIAEIKGDRIRIGISAPRDVSVWRKEVYLDIVSSNKDANEIDLNALMEVQKMLK